MPIKLLGTRPKKTITGGGNVKMIKGEWKATADTAITTSAFQSVKLKGNAKVEKGG